MIPRTDYFEKINKIDQLLARVIKKIFLMNKINKIRNKREVTTDTTEIQRITTDYYKKL